MKGSGIGGQAVMEGVMMKNGDKYAVAVRKPDKEIAIEVKEHKSLGSSVGLDKVPIIRGVVAFIDSLVLGVGTLTYSASFFDEDEEEQKPLDDAALRKKEKQDKAMMAGTVCLSIVLAVGIFMLLPYFLSQLLRKYIESAMVLALLEGVIRVTLFVGYVAAISMMNDIKRVYMYHGAEHKSINCIEHGLELTVENVRTQSRQHKRCGTSFLLIVMLISILFFMFIRVDNAWLRVVVRLILIPVIAGVSYEFIRLAGRTDNAFVNALSKPGMALQKLTTREPDDSMIECAIASVEAVFDWKDFLAHYDEPAKSSKQGKSVKQEKPVKEEKQTEEWEPFADEKDEPAKEEKQTENWEPFADEKDEPVKEDAVAQEPVAQVAETEPVQSGEKNEPVEEKPSKPAKSTDFRTPTPVDDDEDDAILKALDQYFILKQKKDKE